MELKTEQPVKILYANFTTTLNKIHAYVGSVPEELYAEAAKSGFTPSGPQIWIYSGMTMDKDAEFNLDIALPVSGNGSSTKYAVKELPDFKCATTMHTGPWENLEATYQQLIGEVMINGLKLSGVFREVYRHVDFVATEENITEVQAGIL